MDTALSLKFDIDEDLKQYTRGRLMTLKQLQALPDDSIIWVFFEEENGSYDIDGAYRIVKDQEEENCWACKDGSSFDAEVCPNVEELSVNGALSWYNYSGPMKVFHVVKK